MNRIALPLLMLGLSLAPVLCWAAEPNGDQAKAIAEIEKVGGKVYLDEGSPGKPVNAVNLQRTKVTDAGLIHLHGLTKLEGLDLGGTKVTDAGAKGLRKALPNCTILAGEVQRTELEGVLKSK